MQKLKIGMLLFPELTALDFVGPYDVFIKAPCFEVFTIAKTTEPLQAEGGLWFKPAISLTDCPPLDILFVPGGKGINNLLTDMEVLDFLRLQGATAKYITSVCTGSLVLAAAGLLDGFEATTHWRSLELLGLFDVTVQNKRIVKDRNRITAAGVSAGIDFGLMLTALIGGEETAKIVQLQLEYHPEPPFRAGSPQTAGLPVLQRTKELTQPIYNLRKKIIQQLIQQKTPES
ncbi:DJ-1/PfpI family protein [Chitinophaga silvatica]|uniref:DJ-1/PfpI family protein n=1 Tax=Chitinophaga silvatica TaxID=2282649 RepID=A0A3E1Y863_9BACT|nr:DJ-1/PfpI family protein [Chitinophaga silvatica]RFS21346.1 DJ-1/PfpI family protein [Chitinophaga silvatica]